MSEIVGGYLCSCRYFGLRKWLSNLDDFIRVKVDSIIVHDKPISVCESLHRCIPNLFKTIIICFAERTYEFIRELW